MIGIVILVSPELPSSTETASLFHKIAIHENHTKPAFEEAQSIPFPQREETFVISKIIHSTGPSIRKLPKSRSYQTISQVELCPTCLENIQGSLCRLESVFEKPPHILSNPLRCSAAKTVSYP